MAQRPDQRADQGRLASAQVTFEIDDQPGAQARCQQFPETLSGSLVGQVINGGNIGAMHDQDSTVDYTALREEIRAAGRKLGFVAVGVARADPGPAASRLRAWLAEGCHGEMDYMARHAELRAQPQQLHPGTLTVISAALDYLPHDQPAPPADVAAISRYAQGRDYHKVVRGRLQKLADAIAGVVGPFGYRVFSDSAPVMEVEFARQAGLGWRGKHTLLLSKQGSWRFLGEIYTDLPLPPDDPVEEHCGTCSACLAACPTGAIVAPYRVDARRCISYLTIELAGAIPEELRPLLGNRIYGCDDCQLCCPWNRFAQLGDGEFAPRHGLDSASLVALFAWTEEEFEQRLAGNPIRRIGHERWLRNIAVALGNGPPTAAARAALQSHAGHPSALVREHVTWAQRRLGFDS
ncbi:MAG: tRNA epoxyqueuosine(34) reductase QueG [Betaproteobacteria bacterium HGW-Betaproteobacteria-7]|nr:MAG: tRNA epoxyqueuosine(34) reductase QueG [Betaproteobacteria bacterium HGW-Betaproteobacteria-7]